MEFENRLEKWDSLFEELKKILDSNLPEFENMMQESADRISILENRISSIENQIEMLKKQAEKAAQNGQDIGDILKHEIENRIELLEKRLSERIERLKEEVQEEFRDAETVFEIEGIDSLKNMVEEFRDEIGEMKKFMEKLSGEIEQLKGQLMEKHRILREKKVEGRSPRIL